MGGPARRPPPEGGRSPRSSAGDLGSPPGRADRRLVRLIEPGTPEGAPPVAA